MPSVWTSNDRVQSSAPLRGTIHTDVLIVGGGMAGVLCAYMLKQAGVEHVLVEATHIGGGITQNTTAKITWQHGLMYDKLIGQYGAENAALYLQAQQEACTTWERLCATIDCGYEQQDAYVYDRNDRAAIEKETAALQRLGCRAAFCESVSLPFPVAGAVRVENQAQFHPLKFLRAIRKDLRIYENTKVIALKPHKATTTHGEIHCKVMIIATHFPMWNMHGGYVVKLYQHRSYVVALKNAQNLDGMYVDADKKGLSFRGCKDLLLLGGGAHRTGKKGGCWQELEAFAQRNYPSADIVTKWATQDCMTLDGVPYIGQYSGQLPDVYVATGFNKWGMSSSMVAAKLLADRIQGKSNTYETVFDPSRKIWHPQLAINAWESLVGLLTPTAPRCPHLGCALKYNAAEHSWDCPCHGSRFTEEGEIIDNPATGDMP